MKNYFLNELLLANFTTCLLMTGLIWTIQIVHYPSFHYIEKNEFSRFETFHCQRISYLVIPLMIIEIISSILLVAVSFDSVHILNLVLNILIWLATFFWSAPTHQKLNSGKESLQINFLIKSNWPRTILWSLRSLLLIKLIKDHI